MIGLIGKIPGHGDFVRLHASDRLSLALFDWLEAATAEGHQLGAPLPAQPVRFLFSQGDGAAKATNGISQTSTLFRAEGAMNRSRLRPKRCRACSASWVILTSHPNRQSSN